MGWNLHPKLGWRLGDLRKAAQAGNDNARAQRFTLMIQPPEDGTTYLREDYYRYKYEPGSQQEEDPVIHLIREKIRELTRGHCIFANAGIRIYSTTEAPPLWPREGLGADHCIKFYTFTQQKQEFPLTVPITVVAAFDALTVENIYVRMACAKTWIPLEQWLLQIPDETAFPERTTFAKTRHWWSCNGRHFRLMDLPEELRAIVFEHVLGPDVYPLSKVLVSQQDDLVARQNAPIVFGIGYSNQLMAHYSYQNYSLRAHIEQEHPKIAPPYLPILLVSKQVYQEALKAGWEGTKKSFVDPDIFTLVADSQVGPAAQFNCLAKIRLDFTNTEWFRFYGVQVDESGLRLGGSNSYSSYLKHDHLPGLRHFEMRFRNPEDGCIGSPWASHLFRDTREEVSYECCQRTIVGMVCTFAHPFVSHIPTVKVIGFVKKETKTKWEAIYANKVPHDQDSALKTILNTSSELLPPPCFCEQSCRQTQATRWRYYTQYADIGDFVGWTERSWNGGNSFDFEDDEVDNETLNDMCGYGGYVPGDSIKARGRLCDCGCGKLAHETRR